MDIAFYKCNSCGNIVIKVVDSGVSLVCCGEPMQKLVPGAVDAAQEKHVPAVTADELNVHANIGSVDHPMTPDHSIQFICLVTEQGYSVHPLTPDDAPAADFVVADGDAPVAVYEYCNLHGLWVCEL